MTILRLAFLYILASPVRGYGASWHDLPSPEVPSFQRPVDVVTDVINELGVRILQEYGETGHGGNVAFSPTGIGFVLAALYEGSAGPGNEQIAHVLGLPRDKDVTRIGLRDIHRRLRSYLSPDGFLGGLTLNRENTKLRPEYEEVLKFLGFDLPSGDDGTNATDSSTLLPETTPEVMTTTSGSSSSSLPTDTEATETSDISTTSTEESTSVETTVTSRVTDEMTTTTLAPAEVTEALTNAPKETTTMKTIPEELTTLKNDPDGVEDTTITATTAQEISEPPTTIKVEEISEETSSNVEILSMQETTVLATTEPPTTVPQVSSRVTEASSATPPVEQSTRPVSTTQPTTLGTTTVDPVTVTENLAAQAMQETTLASVEEVMKTTKPETTTLQPETTTSMVSEVKTTTASATTMRSEEEESSVETLDKPESESEAEKSEESQEELVTTTTEVGSTLAAKDTSVNEIDYDSTTIRTETTTLDEIDEVETVTNMDADVTTTSSSSDTESSERPRVRRNGIKDRVVRTLLDARSAGRKIKLKAKSNLMNSEETGVNKVVEYSFAEQNNEDITMGKMIMEESQDNENEDLVKSMSSQEPVIQVEKKNRGTRSSRSYFSNFPQFPSFPIYPDFPGLPEESSWTRKVGGWRVHSPKTDETSRDSTELTFLVNGEDAAVVSAATYTVVLPFAFLPTLQALALEFPLDDPRYNILLLLPTDRDGTRRLAKDLGNISLRELRKELQPAWVRAMIPSFMLKGFVTLTPFLQRLGIRDVFEPRVADLSPMTEDVGVYARDVQQSIGVNIRNYMKPDRTHSRNGLFERAGPVSFVAEHPFLFFIIDAETGVSLIAGRIEDPLNSRIL